MNRDLHAEEAQAAWGWVSKEEPRWPAQIAIVVAVGLYVLLPGKLTVNLGARWVVPALLGALSLVLIVVSPHHITRDSKQIRIAALTLIGLINLVNFVSLGQLIQALLYKSAAIPGRQLITSSVPIWLTNVIVFGLWYWELDRGGPARRLTDDHRRPDFLFPQMSTPGSAELGWTPRFFDYLYTSFTNSTAFSPTDTMPLTHWAKTLMALQSTASLLTVALVISRAVNILA
jgi:uncharacterized membrane protein